MVVTRCTRQTLTLQAVMFTYILFVLLVPHIALCSDLRPMPNGKNGIPFYNCFKDSATQYGLDPNLLIAVAIVESSLDPTAVSKANALGLMQIKWPQTAEHLGIGNRSLLFDPCVNINAGARYLAEVRRPYISLGQPSSTNMMLSAYRIGPNAIKGFTKMPPIVEDYIHKVRQEKIRLDQSDAYVISKAYCVLEEFKIISLNTHDPNLRTQKAIDWLEQNQKGCSESNWGKLLTNLPNWLGTVCHNTKVQNLINSAR